MTNQVDEEATNTMLMLDTEVRKKIRQELVAMILNPQTNEERALVSDIVNAAHRVHQMEQMERQRQAAMGAHRSTSVYSNNISPSDYVKQQLSKLSKIDWK